MDSNTYGTRVGDLRHER